MTKIGYFSDKLPTAVILFSSASRATETETKTFFLLVVVSHQYKRDGSGSVLAIIAVTNAQGIANCQMVRVECEYH